MSTPGVVESLELTKQYGIANVLVIILVLFFIALFVMVLRWVFNITKTMMTSAHEEKIALVNIVNNTIKSINESLNQNTNVCQLIMSNVKDGFDKMAKADDYHRQDIQALGLLVGAGQKEASEAREKIVTAINTGCKVKP